MSGIISEAEIRALAAEWIAQGKCVAGPVQVTPDKVLFAQVTAASELRLDGTSRPGNSIKEFFFPKHEPMYSYRFEGKDIRLEDAALPITEQIIIGARPCDAAALPVLDHVFNWDFHDEFFNRRRAATTVITVACSSYDEFCFCTSVGLDPAAEAGSDVLLLSLGDGEYEARCLTEKGRDLLGSRLRPSDRVANAPATPAPRIEPAKIREYVEAHFEDPIWKQQTLRCLGCGACAYTCPTCHCFDIADEGTAAGGSRVKNWDSCQFPMFTMHASGHNPRTVQSQRQRQRIYHKFQIYPEKFGAILCTGCGNCTRNCPAELGVLSVLEAIQESARG